MVMVMMMMMSWRCDWCSAAAVPRYDHGDGDALARAIQQIPYHTITVIASGLKSLLPCPEDTFWVCCCWSSLASSLSLSDSIAPSDGERLVVGETRGKEKERRMMHTKRACIIILEM